MWILLAVGSAVFAGFTSILAKIGIKNTDSNLATALRTIVVSLFTWLMVFLVGSQSEITLISSKTLLFLVLSGASTGASWLCYFKALQIGNINKVVPIDKSSTVLTILLAFLFLGEGITLPKLLCVAAITLGTFLMIEKKDIQNGKEKKSSWLIYALLSALFASLTSIFGKIGIQDVESYLGTAIRTLVVLVMAWLIVFLQKKQGEIRDISQKSWLFIILSGFATGLSWICYYRALQTGPVSVVVPIDKLSILLSVFLGYLIFHEKQKRIFLIGLAMITAGTVILALL